jgi:hypothetical protein
MAKDTGVWLGYNVTEKWPGYSNLATGALFLGWSVSAPSRAVEIDLSGVVLVGGLGVLCITLGLVFIRIRMSQYRIDRGEICRKIIGRVSCEKAQNISEVLWIMPLAPIVRYSRIILKMKSRNRSWRIDSTIREYARLRMEISELCRLHEIPIVRVNPRTKERVRVSEIQI